MGALTSTEGYAYDPEATWTRIGVILNEDPIEETDTLSARLHGPASVVRGTVLFVDVRESHDLSGRHQPVQLARLYRALVSEMITILTDPLVRDIGSTGDRSGRSMTPRLTPTQRQYSTSPAGSTRYGG